MESELSGIKWSVTSFTFGEGEGGMARKKRRVVVRGSEPGEGRREGERSEKQGGRGERDEGRKEEHWRKEERNGGKRK